MTLPRSADDRPDPADQHAVHARVPEHVSRGVFSTGVIVMTAPTEFVIDFIQNLGRPHQVVARVIMPHPVLPQFVDALLKNIELYRARYGNLPQPNLSSVVVTHASGPVTGHSTPGSPMIGSAPPSSETPHTSGESSVGEHPAQGTRGTTPPASSGADAAARLQASGSSIVGAGLSGDEPVDSGQVGPGNSGSGNVGPGHAGTGHTSFGPAAQAGGSAHHESPPVHQRRASAQEIYDDLKMRDDIHSGSYANAVMIGHGPHEFSFDFITNFYPQSAVSARVFLAAGQVARLAESLRGAWDQIRHRFPPGGESPPRH